MMNLIGNYFSRFVIGLSCVCERVMSIFDVIDVLVSRKKKKKNKVKGIALISFLLVVRDGRPCAS